MTTHDSQNSERVGVVVVPDTRATIVNAEESAVAEHFITGFASVLVHTYTRWIGMFSRNEFHLSYLRCHQIATDDHRRGLRTA